MDYCENCKEFNRNLRSYLQGLESGESPYNTIVGLNIITKNTIDEIDKRIITCVKDCDKISIYDNDFLKSFQHVLSLIEKGELKIGLDTLKNSEQIPNGYKITISGAIRKIKSEKEGA